MKGHGRLLGRPWTPLLGVVALIGGHVIFFKRLRHAGVTFVVLSGVGLLVIAKHLGMLGYLYTLFRRPSRPES